MYKDCQIVGTRTKDLLDEEQAKGKDKDKQNKKKKKKTEYLNTNVKASEPCQTPSTRRDCARTMI